MWQDQVLKPGPLALESSTLPTKLHGPATGLKQYYHIQYLFSYKMGFSPL